MYKSGEIPTMDGMMYPMLEVHSDGGGLALRELAGHMSDWLGLSAERRERRTKSGKAKVIDNKTRRAAYHLHRAGLLGKKSRGRLVDCRITQEGEKIVADSGITSLTRTYLERNCPPYQEWVAAKYRSRHPLSGDPAAKRSRSNKLLASATRSTAASAAARTARQKPKGAARPARQLIQGTK